MDPHGIRRDVSYAAHQSLARLRHSLLPTPQNHQSPEPVLSRMTSSTPLAFLLPFFLLLGIVPAQGISDPNLIGDPTVHRVACIGDSITFGSGLSDKKHASWPAILDQMIIGDAKNFGVSGATLLHKGNKPIWKQKAFQAALDYKPTIAFVLLGTNDSKLDNWKHKTSFEADLVEMVQRLRKLESHPRVLLCLPPPAWTQGKRIDGKRIRAEVIPAIRRVAERERCELLDLHTPLLSHKGWFPDGAHPNAFGAEFIAHRAYEALKNGLDEDYDLLQALGKGQVLDGVTQGTFEGFRKTRFRQGGRKTIVVQPHITAFGRPWVWRARFFGHEPQFDRAMLERGWHIAYVDIGQLYGNDQAVAIWDDFYDLLVTKAGLARKPILEGMSRGGLIVYHWAKQYPTQVAGIYGDNAVLDPRSWPGGKGMGKGAPADWKRCLAAYGIREEDAEAYPGFPIQGFEGLAKAGVPLLNLIGMKDPIVPPAENTELLARHYQSLGGSILLHRKPGAAHHPHSLRDPSLMVDFALKATERAVNFAAVPAPAVEFRGKSAGWGGGTWWDQYQKIEGVIADNPDLELIFLGDSITQGLTGSTDRLSHAGGKRLFDRFYGRYKAAGFGISGDRVEHLLYRVTRGKLETLSPKVIVLMIGVNNLGFRHNTGEEIAAGTRLLVTVLQGQLPKTQILLLGCFPSKKDPDHWRRQQIDILHEGIQYLGKRDGVTYLDLRRAFLLPDGRLDPKRMRGDQVHLNSSGLEAWAEAIGPTLREMMGEPLVQEQQPEWLTRTTAVRPTERQVAWQRREFTGFLHFGVNTFTNREWGTGKEDPAIFDPTALDTDQWVRVAKEAGMKMLILTAKHHDGFCLWPTRYTTHSVANSPWKEGKGDVVKLLAESCRKQGLELGIYLSPADLYQIENAKGLYGNGSSYSERVIPRPVAGRPFGDKHSYRYKVDDYNEYYMNQLFELLTEYGPISEVWLDGAHPKRKGGQTYTYNQWYDLIHKLAPQAIIFGKGPGCRWIGNERGGARKAEWSVVPLPVPAEKFTWGDMTAKDLGSRARIREAKYLHWYPAEMDTSIRPGWFYHAKQDGHSRSSLGRLTDLYLRGVGGNAVLLLNVPPDRRGLIHETDALRLRAFGTWLRTTFADNLARGSQVSALHDSQTHPATNVTDGNLDTWWQPPAGINRSTITLTFAKNQTFDLVSLQEQIRQGQRIERFIVEAWTGHGWAHLGSGYTIGHKKLLRFPRVTARKLRVRITSSRSAPTLAEIGVYFNSRLKASK